MGAAVVDRNLIADMLAAGMLAEIAPDPPVAAAEGHWFVALPDRLRLRPVRQFRDWLATEAQRAADGMAAGRRAVEIAQHRAARAVSPLANS